MAAGTRRMKQLIYRRYEAGRNVVLFEGDCRHLLRTLPDASVDLVLSSPPYCMSKEYDTSRSPDEFRRIHAEIFPEIHRALKPGGSLCWQVGFHVRSNIVLPLDYL